MFHRTSNTIQNKTRIRIRIRKEQLILKVCAGYFLVDGLMMIGLTASDGYFGSLFVFGVMCTVIPAFLLYVAFKKSNKWKRYDALINMNGNTDLNMIASRIGKSYTDVCEDIQEMINKDFFIGGTGDIAAYIDHDRQYLVMSRNGKPMVSLDTIACKEPENKNDFDEIQMYVETIRNAIGNEQYESVKDTLYDLEGSVRRIFTRVKKNPSLQSNTTIIKLKNTYLPQTVGLIEKFAGGLVSQEASEQIAQALATCAEAFGNIDRELQGTDDISALSDIEVLKITFERDGVLNSEFDVK